MGSGGATVGVRKLLCFFKIKHVSGYQVNDHWFDVFCYLLSFYSYKGKLFDSYLVMCILRMEVIILHRLLKKKNLIYLKAAPQK